MRIDLPYGKGGIPLNIPARRVLGVLKPRDVARIDVGKLVKRSLERGEARGRLSAAIARKKMILVVVPDATRSAHLKEILPVFLEKIKGGGRKIDIMIATGLHKKHTPGQVRALLGHAVAKGSTVLGHDLRPKDLMDLGRTALGIPIQLDKRLMKYDLVTSIGVIEPHLYAGYSGGAKTIAIGLAGEKTINATHSIRFLDDPLTLIGHTEANPFQATLWEIIRGIPAAFAVNVVNDPDGNAIAAFSGSLRDVFEKGVSFAKKKFEIGVKRPSDIVICGIGYPKDINLYQASRALNYILNVDRPVLRKGGVLIVAARLADGPGHGLTEERFYAELKAMRSPEDFIRTTKHAGCVAGVHRAYMVAKSLKDYTVIFVNRGGEDFMDGLPFPCYKNMADALERADSIAGKGSKIYIIPRALSTIARRVSHGRS